MGEKEKEIPGAGAGPVALRVRVPHRFVTHGGMAIGERRATREQQLTRGLKAKGVCQNLGSALKETEISERVVY